MPTQCSTMSEVIFRSLDYEAVMARLRDHAQRELARRPEVRQVVLIGSLARGDWSARSDADLVVVVDRAPERSGLRGPGYAPSGEFPVSVDAFVYTSQEADRWSPRFRAEVENGQILYRRPEG